MLAWEVFRQRRFSPVRSCFIQLFNSDGFNDCQPWLPHARYRRRPHGPAVGAGAGASRSPRRSSRSRPPRSYGFGGTRSGCHAGAAGRIRCDRSRRGTHGQPWSEALARADSPTPPAHFFSTKRHTHRLAPAGRSRSIPLCPANGQHGPRYARTATGPNTGRRCHCST